MLPFRSWLPALAFALGSVVLTVPLAHAETQDQTVARLLAQAHRQDQAFTGRALLKSAGECTGVKDVNSCLIDRLIVHGAQHGFGLAAYDAQQQGRVKTLSDAYFKTAWPRAMALPINRPVLARQMTDDDQKALDKACPTHEIGCWGPRVLDFGLEDGIRLYLNADKAHALDDLAK